MEKLGVAVQIGHSAEAVGDADCVVYTPAVGEDHPELQMARARGVPVFKRADLLGVLTQDQRVVGVSGTHGKTTTTAMVGAVLEAAGEDPTVLVGGVVQGVERNLQVGSGTWWVVEADEFDRSFLKLIPTVAVVTTLEADHLDCYGDLASVQEAFDQFVSSIPSNGFAVLCGDFEAIQDLGAGRGLERIFYGLDEGVQVQAVAVERDGFGSRFMVRDGDRDLGSLRLQVPGLHNVCNALAAVAVGNRLGVQWGAIRVGLEGFRGVHRRFEILGEAGGVTVVNDYAHHPTEVVATLAAAREGWNGRIVGVFQPHLYTRTRDFADAFGAALCGADQVWTTEIYAAREAPIPGVDGKLILDRVREAGGMNAQFAPTLDGLKDALMGAVQPGDLLVVMGAGDVERVAFEVLDGLQARGDQAD